MKKIILLILVVLLSGCTLNYNLEITEETFKENIEILETDSSNFNKSCEADGETTYKDKIRWLKDFPVNVYLNAGTDPYDPEIEIEGVEYYTKELISNNNEYGLTMSTDGKLADMNNLRSLKFCYDIAQVINNRDEYIISTSFKNNCFDMYPLLDEININITTDMKVTSDNADKVNGNTYTWKITRDNYEKKSISLAMQSIREYKQDKFDEEQETIRKENEKKKEKQKGVVLTALAIIGGIFLVVAIIIGIMILIKNRKENQI